MEKKLITIKEIIEKFLKENTLENGGFLICANENTKFILESLGMKKGNEKDYGNVIKKLNRRNKKKDEVY